MNFFEYIHHNMVFEKENYTYFLYFVGFVILCLFMFNYYQIFKFIQNIFKKREKNISRRVLNKEDKIKNVKFYKKEEPQINFTPSQVVFEPKKNSNISRFLD